MSRSRIAPLAAGKTRSDRASVKRDEQAVDTSGEGLMARLKDGDQEAFTTLFDRHVRLVRRICARILRNETEAEDVAQEVFLFVQRKSNLFDSSKGSALSWIVHMAYQRAIERRRYLVARHFYTREDISETDERVAGQPVIEDDYCPEVVFGRNGLERLLASLSEDQRETLRLHFFQGYTLAEIAANLHQPLGNIRHHYYRGLDKLRKQMFRK